MSTWFRVHINPDPMEAFSGDGGLYVAGRWNYKGRKAVYCANSIALATLEWLSHNGLSVSGFSYFKYSIEIPDSLILEVKKDKLPRQWNATPSIEASRSFSENNFFRNNEYLGLYIPSVVIPEENNLILNPLHPKFLEILKTVKEIGKYNGSSTF